jgi:hypothetical protein
MTKGEYAGGVKFGVKPDKSVHIERYSQEIAKVNVR